MLLSQVNGVRRCTLFSRAFQDRFHRGVDDLALPVTTHNRHNLLAHFMSPSAVSAVYARVGAAFSDKGIIQVRTFAPQGLSLLLLPSISHELHKHSHRKAGSVSDRYT